MDFEIIIFIKNEQSTQPSLCSAIKKTRSSRSDVLIFRLYYAYKATESHNRYTFLLTINFPSEFTVERHYLSPMQSP